MFRRQPVVVTQERTNFVTRTVHEHRAPTDHSVAILKEMETAAKDKVVEAVHVEDTRFSCEIHVIHEIAIDQRTARVIFSLNGRKMQEDVPVAYSDDPRKFVEKICEAVSQRISAEILGPALSRLDAIEWRRFSG